MEKNKVSKRAPLTLEERKTIQNFLKSGKTLDYIHINLKRAYTTIYHEVKKNGGAQKYNAIEAHNKFNKTLSNEDIKSQGKMFWAERFYIVVQDIYNIKIYLEKLSQEINNIKIAFEDEHVKN